MATLLKKYHVAGFNEMASSLSTTLSAILTGVLAISSVLAFMSIHQLQSIADQINLNNTGISADTLTIIRDFQHDQSDWRKELRKQVNGIKNQQKAMLGELGDIAAASDTTAAAIAKILIDTSALKTGQSSFNNFFFDQFPQMVAILTRIEEMLKANNGEIISSIESLQTPLDTIAATTSDMALDLTAISAETTEIATAVTTTAATTTEIAASVDSGFAAITALISAISEDYFNPLETTKLGFWKVHVTKPETLKVEIKKVDSSVILPVTVEEPIRIDSGSIGTLPVSVQNVKPIPVDIQGGVDITIDPNTPIPVISSKPLEVISVISDPLEVSLVSHSVEPLDVNVESFSNAIFVNVRIDQDQLPLPVDQVSRVAVPVLVQNWPTIYPVSIPDNHTFDVQIENHQFPLPVSVRDFDDKLEVEVTDSIPLIVRIPSSDLPLPVSVDKVVDPIPVDIELPTVLDVQFLTPQPVSISAPDSPINVVIDNSSLPIHTIISSSTPLKTEVTNVGDFQELAVLVTNLPVDSSNNLVVKVTNLDEIDDINVNLPNFPEVVDVSVVNPQDFDDMTVTVDNMPTVFVPEPLDVNVKTMPDDAVEVILPELLEVRIAQSQLPLQVDVFNMPSTFVPEPLDVNVITLPSDTEIEIQFPEVIDVKFVDDQPAIPVSIDQSIKIPVEIADQPIETIIKNSTLSISGSGADSVFRVEQVGPVEVTALNLPLRTMVEGMPLLQVADHPPLNVKITEDQIPLPTKFDDSSLFTVKIADEQIPLPTTGSSVQDSSDNYHYSKDFVAGLTRTTRFKPYGNIDSSMRDIYLLVKDHIKKPESTTMDFYYLQSPLERTYSSVLPFVVMGGKITDSLFAPSELCNWFALERELTICIPTCKNRYYEGDEKPYTIRSGYVTASSVKGKSCLNHDLFVCLHGITSGWSYVNYNKCQELWNWCDCDITELH